MAGGAKSEKRAVSPVVATIILIAVFIVVVAAALGFTQTELSSYYANSDLSQSQSFASNMAQAVNSVAFTFGRSVSIGYGFKYAAIAYIPNALKYTVSVATTSGTQTFNVYSGILLVAISAHLFSLGQNYEKIIYPLTYSNLISIGGGGSYTLAYSKEYLGATQPYIYTVVAPIPLALNLTLQSGTTTTPITKLYIAQLVPLSQQTQPPQTCTQTSPPNLRVVPYNLTTGYISAQGGGYVSCTVTNVESITVSVTPLYPQQNQAQFYVFPQTTETLNSPAQGGGAWQLQLYVGAVELGGA